jgi:hypothetical protein
LTKQYSGFIFKIVAQSIETGQQTLTEIPSDAKLSYSIKELQNQILTDSNGNIWRAGSLGSGEQTKAFLVKIQAPGNGNNYENETFVLYPQGLIHHNRFGGNCESFLQEGPQALSELTKLLTLLRH